METCLIVVFDNLLVCSYPTYEEWKQFINIDLFLFWVTQFLSYLWGMETFHPFYIFHFSYLFLSYLWGMETLFLYVYAQLNLKRSYPTYEEWKHRSLSGVFFLTFSSYPTYEEWKLEWNILDIFYITKFLSYLWGMETFVLFFPPKRKELVLILPMRNGNTF